jgi:hypothetical protein
MDVSIKDASQYFRGLLILIRKDGIVTSRESESVARVGAKLGFERSFCMQAIEDILSNLFIDEAPPVFGSVDLARKFIADALRLASAEREMTTAEHSWLQMTSDLNGCGDPWFREECERAVGARHVRRDWEYDSLSVIHTARDSRRAVPAARGGE